MHPNDIPVIPDGAALIPLRAKDGSVRTYALVDAADAVWLNQWTWRLMHGYAVRGERRGGRHGAYTHISMHRVILGLGQMDEREVDHISRDRLDNRRCNLRAIPHRENAQNRPNRAGSSSMYRGVHWHKKAQAWVARIMVNGKTIHLGCFDREQDAAEAASTARMRSMPGAVD